jgi:hypothetical protein
MGSYDPFATFPFGNCPALLLVCVHSKVISS